MEPDLLITKTLREDYNLLIQNNYSLKIADKDR